MLYNLESPGAAWHIEILYKQVFEMQVTIIAEALFPKKQTDTSKWKTAFVIITFHGKAGEHTAFYE